MLDFKIQNLQQRSELLPFVAQWHQQEWHQVSGQVSIHQRMERLQKHLTPTLIPSTWIATNNGDLLGSISLVNYEHNPANDDDSAWVANLFVTPNFRGQGIGQKLLRFVEAQANQAQLQRLYLFTPNHRHFYEQQCWSFLHQSRVQGQWVDIMMKTAWTPSNRLTKQPSMASAFGGNNYS